MNHHTARKQVLLINDLPGYGKVALAAMVPLLSRMGHYTFQLPTAVVSNTLDYGKFRIQDLTDFMEDTLKVWDQLGFDPDCICTGFVLSIQQVDIIRTYLEERSPDRKRLVIVDPIMGDDGHLYNGIGLDRVDAMRALVKLADVMLPNMTEAGFLAGLGPGTEAGSTEEILRLVDRLRDLSGKSVVITSATESDSGRHLVSGYDHICQEYFQVPYEYLPVRVPGSGDIFSAVVTGELLDGKPLKAAVEKAVRVLSRLIAENQGHLQGYKGIQVEQYWESIEEA